MIKNPYLKIGRLPDVIAAITALGNYKYYKLSMKMAAKRISNKPGDANKWCEVFKDHPEFFRISISDRNSEEQVSLVWRRQMQRLFDLNTLAEITRSQYNELSSEHRDKVSRCPLKPSETTALINIAVNLHEQALKQSTASKWWIPIMTAILAFVGATFGSAILDSFSSPSTTQQDTTK